MTLTDARWIALADTPDLRGLRYRYYRSEDDIPAMAEVAQAANEANGETEFISADYLRTELRNPSHIMPEQGMLLSFVDDHLVAFSSIEYSDTVDGDRHYRSLGNVHPDWRRRGIGSAMMAHNEASLERLAAEQRHPGARVLTTYAQDADLGAGALAQARGYQRVRISHYMVRPDMDGIDAPLLPEGLALGPMTREMLPRLWDGMMEAFRDHFGALDDSPAAFRRWSEDPLTDPGLLFVAFDGEEMAAAVQGLIDPDENEVQGYRRGWTDPVFTRRPWRRRGLAYALLGHALLALRDRGMTSAQLGVDSENPHQALTLYERHRFEVVRSASEWHRVLNS